MIFNFSPSGHLDLTPGVRQVQPAALVERRPQVLPAADRRGCGGPGRSNISPGSSASDRSSRCCRRRTPPAPPARSPSACTTAGTAFGCDRLSPVLTTKSGSQLANSRNQACLCFCCGRMWISDRCSTRSGVGTGTEHRHRHLAHGERIALDEGGVTDSQRGRTGRGRCRRLRAEPTM